MKSNSHSNCPPIHPSPFASALAYREANNSVGAPPLGRRLRKEPWEYRANAAYALFHNILGLWTPWQEHRLLCMTLTFREDVQPREAAAAVDDLFSNYIRRCGEVLTWVRVVGRTRKGRLHYHMVLVTEKFVGKTNPAGRARLNQLMESWSKGWAQWGRLFLGEVRDLGGMSTYLANHVELAEGERRNAKARWGSAARTAEDFDKIEEEVAGTKPGAKRQCRWKGIRLYTYAQNFDRIVYREFQRVNEWTTARRQAIAKVAAQHGRKAEDGMQWVYRHPHEIDEAQAELMHVPERIVDRGPLLWLEDPSSTLGARGPQAIYPVVLYAPPAFPGDSPEYWCFRPPTRKETSIYAEYTATPNSPHPGICRRINEATMRLLERVQPDFGSLTWWMQPRSGVRGFKLSKKRCKRKKCS